MPADLTSIEALDKGILNLCTRINAATYELLVMIREFDPVRPLREISSLWRSRTDL